MALFTILSHPFFGLLLLLQLLVTSSFQSRLCDWLANSVQRQPDILNIRLDIDDSNVDEPGSMIILHSGNLVTEVPMKFFNSDKHQLTVVDQYRVAHNWCSRPSLMYKPGLCHKEHLVDITIYPKDCFSEATGHVLHYKLADKTNFYKDSKKGPFKLEDFYESGERVVNSWDSCQGYAFTNKTHESGKSAVIASNLKSWIDFRRNPQNLLLWHVGILRRSFLFVNKTQAPPGVEQFTSLPTGFIYGDIVYLFDIAFDLLYVFTYQNFDKFTDKKEEKIEFTRVLRLNQFFNCSFTSHELSKTTPEPNGLGISKVMLLFLTLFVFLFLVLLIVGFRNFNRSVSIPNGSSVGRRLRKQLSFSLKKSPYVSSSDISSSSFSSRAPRKCSKKKERGRVYSPK